MRNVFCLCLLVGCSAEPEVARSSLRVVVHDAPADVDEVWVEFAGVQAHGEAGWLTVTEQSQTVDLLALQDGVFADLGLAALPAGHYDQVRLDVTRAWIVDDGVSQPLSIPSGSTSGLKIGHGFDVLECGTTTLSLDWDVGAQLNQNSQGFELRPVLTVDATTVEGCGPTLVEIVQEKHDAAGPITVWDYYGDVRALWWNYQSYAPFDPALGTLYSVHVDQTLNVSFDLDAGTPGDTFSFRNVFSGGGYWASNSFPIDAASVQKTYHWESGANPDWTSAGWGYYFETAANTTPYTFDNVTRLTYLYEPL